MIVSQTPLRMSFVGGGSDLKNFYQDEIGAVLSTSIQKYVYISLNVKFDNRLRLSYSKTEDVNSCEQITHPLFRESLIESGIAGGVEIASLADIPASGSGLGSSSAFTAGLLSALYEFQGKSLTKEELAAKTCMIEIDRCEEPIGKQDQYAAVFGGFNIIQFNPDDTVLVDAINCSENVKKKLEASLLAFYTGNTRRASGILQVQSIAANKSSYKSKVRKMVELVYVLKNSLEMGSLDHFGEILDINWRLKKELANGISNSEIDRWYELGLNGGAEGGKLLGAGGSGFLVFFAPPEAHNHIIKSLHFLQKVDFRFDTYGSRIILNTNKQQDKDE